MSCVRWFNGGAGVSRATGAVVAAVLGSYAASWAAEGARPESLPADVVAAWEKAGAETGWMMPDEFGVLEFRAAGVAKEGELPRFRFREWRERMLSQPPPPERAFGLDLSHSRVTEACLRELAGLKSLRALNLGFCKGVADATLKELAGMMQLQALDLCDMTMNDADMRELTGLKQLQTLNLSSTKVTDTGLKELAGMTQMQNLNLRHSDITDEGLKELAGLVQLQALYLGNIKLPSEKEPQGAGRPDGAEGAAPLFHRPDGRGPERARRHEATAHAGPRRLRRVTDAGLKELAGLKQLKQLAITDTKVTDAGLKELAGFTHMQKLDLRVTQVTDAGMKELVGLAQVQELDLFGTRVTDEAVSELKKALPGVVIKK